MDRKPVASSGAARSRVPHILIVDSFSSDNRGDAAILTTMIDSLEDNLGDVELKVHSNYPTVAQATHRIKAGRPLFVTFRGENTRIQRQLDRLRRVPLLGKWLESLARWLFSAQVTATAWGKFALVCLLAIPCRLGWDVGSWPLIGHWHSFVDYCRADVIWGIGGTFYNDNYRLSLKGRLLNLLSGRLLNKLVCVSSHSFGPFRHRDSRWMARFVFNRLDLICCRSENDVEVLHELGVVSPRTEVTADTAWLLQPASRDHAVEILGREGLRVPEGDLCISLSAIRSWLYRTADPEEAHLRYVQTLAEVIDRLIAARNTTVLFISTCVGGTTRDDRVAAEEIRDRLKHPDRFAILRGAYRAEELQAIYGLMHLHIGTRMHSNILALSAGTPVVAIAYEAKSTDLMASLGLSEYLLDIESIRAEDLWNAITKALVNLPHLRKHLLGVLPEMRRRARLNALYVAQLLTEPPGEDSSG